MSTFPYGRGALCILVVTLIAAGYLLLNPIAQKKTTFTVWVTASSDFDAFRAALPDFEARHPGVTVNVEQVNFNSLTSRLQAAFLADLDVPDLVEMEIGSTATLFRGPLKDIGFVDLTDRIHREGLWERMVQARFAPYSSRGRIFGLPQDVCPVMLAYRRDVFAKEGIDPAQIRTWDDLTRVGRRLTIPGKRYMLELAPTNSSSLEAFLFQQGGGYFDAAGQVAFDNEIGVQTMLWFVPLISGPNRISADLGSGQAFVQAIEEGYVVCLLCPDWRSRSMEMDTPRMAGKLGLIPLPAPTVGGRRVSTYGGTMMGITKRCKNPDLAWELAKFLYFDRKIFSQMYPGNHTIPALREMWNHPVLHEKSAFWGGQAVGEEYAKYAADAPPQYSSPLTVVAHAKLGEALIACSLRYRQYGEKDFPAFVRARLKQSADEVRLLAARNPYE